MLARDILVNAGLILAVDAPWLFATREWSGSMIRGIQGAPIQLKVLPALIVYLALGYLLTLPKTVADAFALGTATYAVYDFTNLATLRGYKPDFAVADTLWGGVLFVAVAWIKSHVKV